MNLPTVRISRGRAGKFHDLETILEAIEHEYFGGGTGAEISWGRWPRGLPHWGRCDFDAGVIRVCPVLDQGWVPAYFLEHVVYHELLHFVRDHGAHDELFREAEERYRHHARALAWEQKHLSRLLRIAARRRT